MTLEQQATAARLLPCPFCGGPAVNVAAEYITCGAAWDMDCPGHSVKCDPDLWNKRTLAAQPGDAAAGDELQAARARIAELEQQISEMARAEAIAPRRNEKGKWK